MKKGSQLSLFNDAQVRRSFISRFTMNPKKDLIKLLRMENLHGKRLVISVTSNRAISHISANLHFENRHKPFVKIGRRYFYN